jgi:hypothetical protein
MVWVQENPKYDENDKKLLKYLRRSLGEVESKRIVNVFSLYKYLKNHDIKSAKDIETSAYYDEKKMRPVFSPSQAKKVFSMMKQSGGATLHTISPDEAHIYDLAIRDMIEFLQSFIPTSISSTANSLYSDATFLKSLENNPTLGYYIGVGKQIFVEATKTTVSTTTQIANTFAVPTAGVSEVIAIPNAIAIFFVVITHVLDDELGEAFVSSLLAIPFIGPVMYKAAGSLGRVANKVIGAKRFSTRRRKVHKWRRTRSVRH